MAAARTLWRIALAGGLAAAVLALAAAAPRPAAAQVTPVITAIGTTGCVAPGERLRVRGRHFGTAGGLQLVLRDPNTVVPLPVSSWNDRLIAATVPQKSALQPGKWYVLGIQHAQSGTWLSGQGRPLQICANSGLGAGGKTTVLPPPPDKPADKPTGKPDPSGNPSVPGGSQPDRPDPRPGDGQAAQPERLQPPAPAQPGAPGAPVPPGPAAADPDRLPDEILAITGTLADATALAQQVTPLGYAVRSLQELPSLGFAIMRLGLPGGTDVPAALDSLRQAFPATLFDANTLYEPEAAAGPSEATAAPRHYAKALIGWPAAGPRCAAGVAVGLIDTAVDSGHEALAGSDVVARSFIAAGVPPAPPDHGTAVAALLVGAPDSQASGLLPAARLYAAAIFSVKEDNRIVGTTDAIARAIDWLGQQGVRVVNLSLSGPGNQVMRLTAERAVENGMVLVAAAGNEGPNAAPVFPAGYPPVMAVTAVDASLQAYREANRGDYIDLAAPGVDVWSARGGQGGRYNTGTSFAAPFVAAAAALALAQNPDDPPQRVRDGLRQIARDLGTPGRDSTFGWGLLQPPAGC